ncbi:MAG: hypothetical protein ABW196_01115 [Solirubrobacterales bacterium]
MIRAMLNLHPDIELAGEVPLRRFPSLKALIGEAAEYQGGFWTKEQKTKVVRAIWYAMSRPSGGPPARRWGMKTPWAELDHSFWGSLVDPLYVYALRRGDRVFQSRIKLGWHNGSPAGWIDRYKRSIRAFEDLRSRGAAHIVQLDLVNGPDDRRRMAEEIFDFVGEDPEAGMLEQIAQFSQRLNNPTSKPGEEPQLPDEWRLLLEADDEYQKLMAAFGY